MVFKRISTYIYINLFILASLFSLFIFNKKVKGENSPFISVIIPVYNTEEYLPKCLDSLINQTYENIEIICVNDGSKDNSLKILNEYAKKDKRIKIIDKENGGVSSARNIGIDNAKGEYISFIDSDDYVNIDTYEIIKSSLGNKEYTFLTFGYVNEPEKEKRPISEGVFYAEDFLYLPYPIGYAWNTIYKRSFINENNLRFNTNVSVGEDNLFIQMCILKAKNKKIKVINDKLYHYIDRGTGRYSSEKILNSALERGKVLLEFCAFNKITDKYDWALNFSVDLMYDKIKIIDDVNKKKLYAKKVLEIINNKYLNDKLKRAPEDVMNKVNELKPVAL